MFVNPFEFVTAAAAELKESEIATSAAWASIGTIGALTTRDLTGCGTGGGWAFFTRKISIIS